MSPPMSDPLTYPTHPKASIHQQASIQSAEVDFRLKLERISILETSEFDDSQCSNSPPTLPPRDY